MLEPSDYIKAKERMLLVSEVADLMLRAPDKLRFDEATYKIVAEALANNRDDVRSMFAEMDMMRASLGLPFIPERSVEDDGSSDGATGGSPVGGVQPAEDAGSSVEVRHDSAGDGGTVQGGGAHGKRAKRPKSRRNKKSDDGSAAGLDAGNAAEPVGGGEG